MSIHTKIEGFVIREATVEEVPLVLDFIRKLAVYEKLLHEVTATEEQLKRYLFGEQKVADVVIGYFHGIPVGKRVPSGSVRDGPGALRGKRADRCSWR